MGEIQYSPAYIFYYCFAAFSFCCSLYVAGCILSLNSIRTSSTRIILYLHITLLIEDIVSLPFIFTGSHGACKFVAFVKYYSGLSNIAVIGFMIILYRAMLFDHQHAKNFIAKYSELIIFGFPLITLLPFSTDSYHGYEHTWCVLDGNHVADLWSLLIFYLWAWLLIIGSVFSISRTLYKVFRVDKELASKLFTSVGMYMIVSVICWIPRSVNRAQRLFDRKTIVGYYGDTIVLFVSGVLYFLIFLTEKTGVIQFETFDEPFKFSESIDRPSVPGNPNRLSLLSTASNSEMLERQSNLSVVSAGGRTTSLTDSTGGYLVPSPMLSKAIRPSVSVDRTLQGL